MPALVDVALDSMSILATPPFRLKVDDAHFSCLPIGHSHWPHVLNVHGSNDQVFYLRVRPVNGEVLVCVLEPNVLQADGLSFHVSHGQTHFHLGLHPEFIVLGLGMGSGDGWVVTHLFADILELGTHVLECFSKYWVKRFRGPSS